MSGASDETLAVRAANGRLECFEELLARLRDRVYRVCYRMAGNAEDAEDWAQESFLRIYQRLHTFDPAYPFQTWLLRVVTNTCINLMKTRSLRQEMLKRQLQWEVNGDSGSNPLSCALVGEEARLVREAIERLSPHLKQALVLKVMEQLTFRELAEVTGVPVQTAATRVRRALDQVRKHLADRNVGVER